MQCTAHRAQIILKEVNTQQCGIEEMVSEALAINSHTN